MGSLRGQVTGGWVVELGRSAGNAERDTNECRKVLEAEPRGSQVLKHGIREKRLSERRVREDAEGDGDERSLADGRSRTREAVAPTSM